jgi:hypothetical protein
MHTLLRDFLSCFSRAAAFSNVENLGSAMRLMHELHMEELEQHHQQQLPSTTGQRPSSKQTSVHDITHSPVHTSIF